MGGVHGIRPYADHDHADLECTEDSFQLNTV
jgi:hypothetical protein